MKPAAVPSPTVRVPSATVGSLTLSSPVLTAAGTAGHGDELAAYVDLARIGAVVVKSQSVFAWQGNPAPRVHGTPAGMLNAVGLQGRGIEHWMANDLAALTRCAARVVASIWGFRETDYREAARLLARASTDLTAVEVNLSCPNLDHAREMFAHDAKRASAVVAAVRSELPPNLPVWVKLSPNTDALVRIAGAVVEAGAETVVLVNTVLGMAIDTATRRPALGNGGGGLSGAGVHAIAVRSVFDVFAAHPGIPIVGVGGVGHANEAIELMLAGASAVQVGTATFVDPRAVMKVHRGMLRWAKRHSVGSWSEIIGAAH